MASDASRQDLRHVSPFSSGSGRRLATEPQLLAQPGAIDHPPAHAAPATPAPRARTCAVVAAAPAGRSQRSRPLWDLLETPRTGGFRGVG
jgi:hypothetical protein